MNAIPKLEIPATMKGIRVVDADTHISEWDDLWTSRATPKYKDRVPQKLKIDGKLTWAIDGKYSLGTGSPASAVRKDGGKSHGFEFLDWELKDVHPGAYGVKARVEYMDENGIQAQIAYPNVLGFGGQRAAMVDPELRLVSSQIYNDAMAELQAESGNRIFPMCLLPWWDVKESVKEAKRGAKMGMRGVNINSDPQVHGLPSLGDPHWNPLWEACLADDLPVNFHVGASDTSMSFGLAGFWGQPQSPQMLAFASVNFFVNNARVLTNLILSGVCERFPTLKIVSVESGVGWIPFVLEALHYEMDETKTAYTATPKEIFQRQIYGCTWFERESIVDDARRLGIDNVLFETDFPHPTCLYPGALNFLADATSRFTPEERIKVLGANAARVYNLPPAAALL
jgi:predicted TIM-barrel fold metal-dependent hydrolase